MSKIQASAKMKIPPGMLEEFKQQVAEYIKQVKEKDMGLCKPTGLLVVIRQSVKSEKLMRVPNLL